MKHNDLFLLHYIFSSDDDGNPVADLYVGYDEKFNLIVLLELTDYDFPEHNSRTYAVIKKGDAFKLARRLKASMVDLPTIVSDAPDDDYYDIINPSIRDVRDCFADILDCFADERCRFRVYRA